MLPGTILALDDKGKLEAILPAGSVDEQQVIKLSGILTPGFVNAHCHLELSHLKGKIPEKTGLPAFGKQVIIQRNSFTTEEKIAAQKQADEQMWKNGIVAVGDICNNNESFETKTQSSIYYHSFIELIGLNPERTFPAFNTGLEVFKELLTKGLKGSLAPHAPYSTSTNLIEKIAAYNTENNLVSTIHNQESVEENKFFHGIENGFYDLYKFLQLDISWFKAPMTSSLASFAPYLKNQSTILVHNTTTRADDISAVEKNNVYWCLCPNANLYIEDCLPDFELLLNSRKMICVGTDSLASNHSLDLIAEINHVLSNSSLSLDNALRALTHNGAKALDIEDKFGELHKGKNAGLNLLSFENNQLTFNKKIA